jgi:hypothetical protein
MQKRAFFFIFFFFTLSVLHSKNALKHSKMTFPDVCYDLSEFYSSSHIDYLNSESFANSQKSLIPVQCSFSTSQDIGTTLLLTWTSFVNTSSYVIQYRLPGGSWIGNPAPTNQIKLANLTPNTYYECRIYIYKQGTFWNTSQVGNFTTGSVSYSKTLDMGTAVQMSWNSFAPWASNYTIQYRPIGTTNWSGVPSNTNIAKLTNLIPNTSYECKVNVYTNGTLWGICQTGTFQSGEIILTKSQDMGTTLLMAWTGFSWASGYSFQCRRLGTVSWISGMSSQNQLKVSNLMPDTDYECRVIVYTNGSLWDYSAIDTIHTALVSFTIISDNPTSMQIGWNSFSSWATSYILQYRLPMSSYWSSSTNTTNTNVQISPLLNGQDYFIRLKVFVGSLLWGNSQEEKIGRNQPSVKFNSWGNDQPYDFSVSCDVFPNPFVEQINLEIFSNASATCSWSLFDVNGRGILSSNEIITMGNNNVKIDATNLIKGFYLMKVMINNEMNYFKIVKQ